MIKGPKKDHGAQERTSKNFSFIFVNQLSKIFFSIILNMPRFMRQDKEGKAFGDEENDKALDMKKFYKLPSPSLANKSAEGSSNSKAYSLLDMLLMNQNDIC